MRSGSDMPPMGIGGRSGRPGGAGGGRYEAAKANVKRPSLFSATRMRWKDVGRLALVVVLPPLGMIVLWRSGYLLRAKIIFSSLAFMMLTLYFTLYLGANVVGPALPPPVVPQAAPTASPTPAPTQAMSLALPIQPVEADAPPTPSPTKKGQTIVYSVRNNPKLYHKAATCDTQKNARSLTLDDAKRAGLKPCTFCKPVK